MLLIVSEAQHSENLGIIAESVSLKFDKVQEFKQSVVNKLTGGVEGLLKVIKLTSFVVKLIS